MQEVFEKIIEKLEEEKMILQIGMKMLHLGLE